MDTPSAVRCHLLELPPELRINIFEYVLQAQKPLRKALTPANMALATGNSDIVWLANITDASVKMQDSEPLFDTSLLTVSRSIYHESIAAFYEVNSIAVPCKHPDDFEKKYQWLYDIQHLRNLVIKRCRGSTYSFYFGESSGSFIHLLDTVPKLRSVIFMLDDLSTFSDLTKDLGLNLRKTYDDGVSFEDVPPYFGHSGIKGFQYSIQIKCTPLWNAWSRLRNHPLLDPCGSSPWNDLEAIDMQGQSGLYFELLMMLNTIRSEGKVASAMKPWMGHNRLFPRGPLSETTLEQKIGSSGLESFTIALAQSLTEPKVGGRRMSLVDVGVPEPAYDETQEKLNRWLDYEDSDGAYDLMTHD